MPRRALAVVTLSLLALAHSALCLAQTVRVVDDDGHGSAASCDDSAPAFTSIGAAIVAAAPGDTVRVCPGTYVESIDFGGKAITVQSADGPGVTIIDGNAAGCVVTFKSGEGLASVLDGFTIRNGKAAAGCSSHGGGVWIHSASPTVRNNVISNNVACAGLAIGVDSGSPLIESNTISGNSQAFCSGVDGGAVAVFGLAGPTIRGNRIADNTVHTNGGGLYLSIDGTLGNPGPTTVERNVIVGNRAVGGSCSTGGGVMVVGGPVNVVGNLIAQNEAGCGGGIAGAFYRVVNNTIAANLSPAGSAMYVAPFGTPSAIIENNIIVAAAGQPAIACGDLRTEYPSGFRFNDVFSPSGATYGGHCLDQTGANGNFSADPKFVDSAGGDFRLLAASAAIDAGDSGAAVPAVDLDGSTRVTDGDGDGVAVVDLGAYEAAATAGPTASISGAVHDQQTSQPLNAVAVHVLSSDGEFVKQALTTASGSFVVSGLQAGTYYARTFAASAQDYVDRVFGGAQCGMCDVTSGTPIAVNAAAESTGVDFLLTAGGEVSGFVKSAEFQSGITGIAVQAYDGAGVLFKYSKAVSGNYSVHGLPSGTYYVRTLAPFDDPAPVGPLNTVDLLYDGMPCMPSLCDVTRGAPISVTAHATRTGVDFTLPTGGFLAGRVVDGVSGSGIAGVPIDVYNANGTAVANGLSDATGQYRIPGMLVGSYFARTMLGPGRPYGDELFDGNACGGCAVTDGTPIVISFSSYASADFALFPSAKQTLPGGSGVVSLSNATETQWVTAHVETGRSYCAQIGAGPAATGGAAAIHVYGATSSYGGPLATSVCFIADRAENLFVKVNQTDGVPHTYRLRFVETTLFGNWFFTGADYSSYTILRNTTETPVTAQIWWIGSVGVGFRFVTIGPRSIVFYDARALGLINEVGSVHVVHDGEPQALVASQTTLSSTTGLSFDSVFVQRR